MIDSSSHSAVGNSLLETKLYIPKWRTTMVSRPRLVERLHQGVKDKLTLISAPAGFGKTSLLAEWLADTSNKKQPATWISLDPGDNDPTLFWSYFITALQPLKLGVGESTLSLLYASQAPPITSMLSTLINEISTIERDFALILDDYHIIENEEIHSALAFVIDHLPAQMHLVIASRSELSFPTARLRARRELTELRVGDLQFLADEVRAFFKQSMGLNLADGDVTALGDKTEGWIAGLQLAALSIQGRTDVQDFVRSFGGDDRYIADFLVEEVLRHQPETVRHFLLQTAVLDRLSGSLCDALTEQDNSQHILQILEDGNLFVIPLDDKRRWYRYHHLFRDTLREILAREYADQASVLHERASVWYEQNGLRGEAIHHAFAADKIERVADLVEVAADDMFTMGQSTTLYGWLKKLPESVLTNRPVLSFWKGWAFLDRGEIEASKGYFQHAEQMLGNSRDSHQAPKNLSADMVIADDRQLKLLPGRLATAMAMSAQASGDPANTVKHAQRALDLLLEDDFLWRGGTTVILGLTSWASGNLALAYQVMSDGFSVVEKMGELTIQIAGAHLLADIRIAQGRLREALDMHKQLERVVNKRTGSVIQGTADLYLFISGILLEQGDFERALQYFEKGKDLGEDATNIDFRDRWFSTEARIKEIGREYDAALALLDEAEQHYVLGPVPYARPYTARKARILISQRRLSEAHALLQGLSVDDELSYLQEYEHITLARMLIARCQFDQDAHDLAQAKRLLVSLQEAAEEGGRMGSLIETLMLQAIAGQLEGERSTAVSLLKRALNLAEPENYVQVFVDEGTALHDLVKGAIEEGIGGDFSRRIYTTLLKSEKSVDRAHRGGDVLIEPLSNREIEVLRLIAAGMRNQEIADQLYISLATVKRHISNIYGKLEVTHRIEAVKKANELNLL